MWSKVSEYIHSHHLLTDNGLYVVALSGGADSVALLLLLSEAGYRVHAAHCNFHLRGEESDRDEAFCESLCRQQGVELHRVHFDTRQYAELHKVSIEMAARDLRYRWFSQLCEDIGAVGVCVAHHQDDSAETVLMNIMRGTGLRGLTGIQPQSVLSQAGIGGESLECRVLRPLLCVTRREIETFLDQRHQPYVTDSSNLQVDVLRNKVRLQVLPLLHSISPAVPGSIVRMAEHLSGAQRVLDKMLEKLTVDNTLNLRELEDDGSREYFAYEWLRNYGFNGAQAHQILTSEIGSIITSSMGYDVLRDRERLLLEPSMKPMKSLVIPEEGTYVVDVAAVHAAVHADNVAVKAAKAVSRIRIKRCAPYVSKDRYVATLDADKVCFPLTLRRVEEGDKMIPFGMKGHQLLSDLMTNCKMTGFEKRRQLVLVDARQQILWAVALRVDHRFAVDNTTHEVLEIFVALHL